MAGVWLRTRCEIRSRLGATLVLAMLIATAGGLAMGLGIGARRTATVPNRLMASLDGRVDVQILDLGKVEVRAIERLSMVERVSVSRFLVSDAEFDLMTSTDQAFSSQLVEGRIEPDDPLAAVLDGETARTLDVGVGDHATVMLATVSATGPGLWLARSAPPSLIRND